MVTGVTRLDYHHEDEPERLLSDIPESLPSRHRTGLRNKVADLTQQFETSEAKLQEVREDLKSLMVSTKSRLMPRIAL